MEGITIITCSRNKGLLEKLKDNIKKTIGVEGYELIAIDNFSNQYSLSSAYNKCISKSIYDILCFVHEDVRFLTQNWGKVLLNKFKDKKIVSIGVAGSTYLSEDPIWFSKKRPFVKGQVVHKFKEKEQLDRYDDLREDVEVVVLDGLFIAVKKEIAEEFKFDQENFNGFHFYDIDFTLRIAQKYNIIVTYDILVQHLSSGNYDEKWQYYKEKFKEKHKKLLPFTKLKEITETTGHWKAFQYDSSQTYPKVLVSCPTSFHKEHCLQDYAESIKNLTYPNYDSLLVDNSGNNNYVEKIRALELPVIHDSTYFEYARDRIVHSRNLSAEYALKQGYDYLLSIEQDVIPPKDIIERMLAHNKQVVTGIYFNRTTPNGKELTPLAYKIFSQESGKLPSMRSLSKEELWSNELIEVVSAGLGCLLIHKNVLKQVKFRYDPKTEAFDDRYFFIDLYNLKIKSYADTSIKCKHYILNRPYQWKDIKK